MKKTFYFGLILVLVILQNSSSIGETLRRTLPGGAVMKEGVIVDHGIAAPRINEFVINHGAGQTANRRVNLHFQTDQQITQFRASQTSGFPGVYGIWHDASGERIFILEGGNGNKTIYLQVRTSQGILSQTAQDTIQLAIPAPRVTSLSINGGRSYTTSKTVRLNNTTDISEVTHYRASQSSAFPGAYWKAYSRNPQFTLTDTMGDKTVFFQVKNATGASPVSNDKITLTSCQYCYGAVGSQCGWGHSGALPLSSCVGGECFINAGSWQHDTCCFFHPDGEMCDPGGNPAYCKAEWDLAVARSVANLSWRRRVDFNKANCSGQVVFNDYCAPTGNFLLREDGKYCCNGKRTLNCSDPREIARLTAAGHNPLACQSFVMCK
jgi:hypothetical protein